MRVLRPRTLIAVAGVSLLLAGCGSAASTGAPAHHASHAKKAAKAKSPSTKPAAATGASAPFIASQDPTAKTVTLSIVSGATIDNFYYNFDGYDQGNATITVPQGWTVKVDFTNENGSNSSVVIAPSASNLTPAFTGAASTDPSVGMQAGQSQTFQFVASTAGSYVLACGVPGQASQDGMWIKFVVSSTATQASSQH
jgi:uncharacterized cupredoxin-like copper-binding protein